MRIEQPFHKGELLVQQRLGESQAGQQNGRIISNSIQKGALRFIEQQPMVILGSIDQQQDVWASILFGCPGFVKAVDERTVELDLTQAADNREDPLWTNIKHQAQVGMLVIELATRRRLRINGRIAYINGDRLRLTVDESYPNCPKYIQRRHATVRISKSARSFNQRTGTLLEPHQQEAIAAADTFFVASAHPRGVDASHRGGNPGFVQVLNNHTLRIPDYSGNSLFNTLGNFAVNPRAGLVFLDFERSRTLQLSGRPDLRQLDTAGGTNRYWNLEVEQWLETELPPLLQWEFLDYSPHNPS